MRQRLEHLLSWLKDCAPDIVCLQEIKCLDEAFPAGADRGARLQCRHPWPEDLQRRRAAVQAAVRRNQIRARRRRRGRPRPVSGRRGDARNVACCGSPAFICPMATRRRPKNIPINSNGCRGFLSIRSERLKTEEPLVLAGDFNVIPTAEDVHNPAAWVNDALFRPQPGKASSRCSASGLTDALRAVTDAPGQYTFWDYQAGAWQKNQGLRIDHLLLSPQASDRLIDVGIDSYVRGWEKPSDHVPVWADLDLGGIMRRVERCGRASGLAARTVSPCGPAPSARASAAPSRDRRRRPWRSPCCSFP